MSPSGHLKFKYLARELVKREIRSKYQGSVVGIFWVLIHPILMLSLYTFFFSVVLKARWDSSSVSNVDFALILFPGLMIYTFFSECISRSPTLIISNVSYVKKIVFPLSILPIISLAASLFQLTISLIIWICFCLILRGSVPSTILFMPLIIIPLIFFVLGLSWFLSSIGTFFRDIAQIVGPVLNVMMFLSPVFYSADRLPQEFRWLLNLNPLSQIIIQSRNVMFYGEILHFSEWVYTLTFTAVLAVLGYFFFQKTKRGFADVV